MHLEKDYLIKLTLAVYRVTELMPESEPLRYKIRESANDVLADLIMAAKSNPGIEPETAALIDRKIDILYVCIDVAKQQNWADPRNFLALQKEYDKIKEDIRALEMVRCDSPQVEKAASESSAINARISPRQQQILEILAKSEKMQAGGLQQLFPGVTKRTIRRDLDTLVSSGKIQRRGEWNTVSYSVLPVA